MSYAFKAGPPDSNARYVYLAIADYANEVGFAFPSLEALIAKTRLSKSTVRRCIANLEADGWLEVKRGVGKGKRSEYTLKEISKRAFLPNTKGVTASEKRCQCDNEKESQRQAKGVTATKPPYPLIGVTVIEPPLNHQGEPSCSQGVETASTGHNTPRYESAVPGEEMQAAIWLFNKLGAPSDHQTRDLAAQAIRIQAREWSGIQQAAQKILEAAKAAKSAGETRWRFWFADAGYLRKSTRKNEMKGECNGGQQRSDANEEAARRALERLTGKCAEGNGRDAASKVERGLAGTLH
jgi:DNA-binding MarR family transcriptional regulator